MRTLATLILTVTPVLAAPGIQGGPASPPDELAARIARVAPDELTAEDLAVILLDASLEEVTRWLEGLDHGRARARRSPGQGAEIARVRRRAEEVPGVLQGLLSEPTIPSEAHAHALALVFINQCPDFVDQCISKAFVLFCDGCAEACCLHADGSCCQYVKILSMAPWQ